MLAVPFELAGEAKAALNTYASTPYAFDERVRDFIQSEVRLSSTTLRLAVRMAAQHQTETDMTAAMESRTTIDLAVGIVMGQNRCSQDEAFRILAAASSNRNIKLRDLAAELVATVGRGPVTTRVDR